MTDYNLPPGCSTSDIPGCRPEDEWYAGQMESALDDLDNVFDDYEDLESANIISKYQEWDKAGYWHRHVETVAEREALAFGHECVVRQRVRQKAINEDLSPNLAIRTREKMQEWARSVQHTLDSQ